MNERNLHKILRNIMLSHDYHIFRVNFKKKNSVYRESFDKTNDFI